MKLHIWIFNGANPINFNTIEKIFSIKEMICQKKLKPPTYAYIHICIYRPVFVDMSPISWSNKCTAAATTTTIRSAPAAAAGRRLHPHKTLLYQHTCVCVCVCRSIKWRSELSYSIDRGRMSLLSLSTSWQGDPEWHKSTYPYIIHAVQH